MSKVMTGVDPEVIRDRRKLIRDDAKCVGCGAALVACEALRKSNTDPTAPEWMGCCAMGAGTVPCRHEADPGAYAALLKEIEAGTVRPAAEIVAEREARRAGRGPISADPMTLLDQGEWWRQKSGKWIRIAEMTPGHRYNTAAMILRNASAHAFSYVMQFTGEVAMHDGGDVAHSSLERALADLERETERDPQEWMRRTELYKALTAGLTIQGDGTRPWQAEAMDPVTGTAIADEDLPPVYRPVCEIPACGCSGEAHA